MHEVTTKSNLLKYLCYVRAYLKHEHVTVNMMIHAYRAITFFTQYEQIINLEVLANSVGKLYVA
jgi:hypothetical protein